MIRNLWTKVCLYCGNHENASVKMEPHEAPASVISQRLYGYSEKIMFYTCPKYYPEHRSENEVCCRNHISVNEFEKMLAYFSDEMEAQLQKGAIPTLTGLKWKSRAGVEYRVIRQSDDHLDVV